MIIAPRFRRLLAAMLAIVILASSATGASAHAELISSDPIDGAVLEQAPAEISLNFGEPVTPTALSLITVGGAPQPLDASSPGGAQIVVPLPTGLADGSYLFNWRVTSIDGHPVAGAVGFAIGAPNGELAETGPDLTLSTAIWAVRALQYVALFLGVGTLAFGLFAPLPRAAATMAFVLAVSGLVLTPVALRLQGLDLLGLPLNSLELWPAWIAGAGSSYGATQMALAIAFTAASLSRLGKPGIIQRALLIVAALAGALAPVLSGHASTASPQLLTRPAVFVHVASLMFWTGALIPLALLLRDHSARGTDALRRFSRLIPAVIAALLVSGTALALVQFGSPGPGWLSPYAALLAAKLALVALLLALALYNRIRLTNRVLESDAAASRRLRSIIVVEVALVVVVLGIVSGWRFTPPPRAIDDMTAAPAMAMLMAGSEMADLEIEPRHAGPVSARIVLPEQQGAVKSVVARFSLPAAGIEALTRPASQTGEHIWQIDGLILPAAGQWTVAVAVRIGDFDLTTYTGSISIEPASDHERNASMHPLKKLLSAAVLSAGLGLPAAAQDAAPVTLGDLQISGAFSRATLPNAPVGAGYLTILNTGPEDDQLVSVASPVAGVVQLHEMKMEGDVMKMGELPDGIAIPAGGSIALAPGGYHIMFMDLKQALVEGTMVPVTLTFAKAGSIEVELAVGAINADAPAHDSMAMGH